MTIIKNVSAILVLLVLMVFTVKANAQTNLDNEATAHRAAVKLDKLKITGLPTWTSSELRERFRELRDKKFLEFEGEPRRIPWLYARDGCHMRATHFIEEAARLGYEKPKKVFVFGAIEIKGAIIPTGSVEPWFHAAPMVEVDGVPMVLDPSVSFSKPLSLEAWSERIVKNSTQVIYSICEADTYLPTSKCYSPEPIDRKRLNEETQLFLKFERNILSYIGLEFKE